MTPMEKAYDLKVLLARLKEAGLDVAEDAAEKLLITTLDWTEESAKLSATPIDDVSLPFIPHVKKLALGYTDKINGKEG